MATITKDLGIATAYGYAVAGGYVGTEEEFTELLGNIADDLSNIENLSVVANTLPEGSSATASYADGVLTLGIPKGDTGSTGATPNMTIGTVSTLPAGDNATATIGGTAENPTLSLGIPQGASGDANNIASDFSTSKAYGVGDYVIYSGDLYRFTSAHTAGAWSSGEVVQVALGNDVRDINQTGYIVGGINAPWERGRIDSSGYKSANNYDIRFADFYPVGKYRTIEVIFNFPANQNVDYYQCSVAQYSSANASGFIGISTIFSTDAVQKLQLNSSTKFIKVYIRAYPYNTTVIDLNDSVYMLMYWADGTMAKIRDDSLSAVVPYGDRYSQTSTNRSFTVTRSIASGERFSIKVLRWTGQTPTEINLYLSTDGINFVQKSQVATVNDWINYTADQAYVAFRIGMSVDAQTVPQTLELLFTAYHEIIPDIIKTNLNPYIYGKNILLGGASIVQGYGGTDYAMDGDVIIDISDTPEGESYSSHGLWKRNTSGYCWANLFKSLCETEYSATVDNNACQGTDISFWKRHADVLIPSGYDLFIYTHSSNDRNYDPATARTNIIEGLSTLLARCKSLDTQMIVLSPPPASKANEDTKQTKTWQLNEFIKEACSDLGIQYFDLQNEVIKYYFNQGASSAGTYTDGIHPNDNMYYVMYFCYCWLLNISPTGAYEQLPV